MVSSAHARSSVSKACSVGLKKINTFSGKGLDKKLNGNLSSRQELGSNIKLVKSGAIVLYFLGHPENLKLLSKDDQEDFHTLNDLKEELCYAKGNEDMREVLRAISKIINKHNAHKLIVCEVPAKTLERANKILSKMPDLKKKFLICSSTRKKN